MLKNENNGMEESRRGINSMADTANLADMSAYRDPASAGTFKLIGYLFNISDEAIDRMKWEKLTHINYAFAIPTAQGTIRSLNNKALVKRLIATAHENCVKVAISVGGWSYNCVALEGTFLKATDTDEKCRKLSESILRLVDEYGFDGVDMDWEYPRKGISEHQYEYFMTFLRLGLSDRDKFLAAAVIGCGPVGEGQTKYILDMLDWINVMAYDGDKGAGHSPYSYMVNSGEYWSITRGVDKCRVVMGVPFYARPSGVSYAAIIAKDKCAAYKDAIEVCQTTNFYNGLITMADKTKWVCENAGGIMIWEITQDTVNKKLSLLNLIDATIREYYPD